MKPSTFHATLFFTLLCVYGAKAQYSENDFIRYTVKDGLSDNFISCLQQDAQGYLWIGTEAGLNRFDGASFKPFYQGTAPLQLPSGVIVKLKRFGADGLGIITRGGFVLLNTKTYAAQPYRIADSTPFAPHRNSAWDAAFLSSGALALTTAAGFYVFDKTGALVLRHDAYNLNDVGRKRIFYGRDIFCTGDKQYLVYVEEDRLASFDAGKNHFQESNGAGAPVPFAHPPQGNGWMVRQQLNRFEFVFIPNVGDRILYYNSALSRNVVSSLPPSLHHDLFWNSKLTQVSDSVFLINSATTGFYRLVLNKQTGAFTCNREKFLPAHKINFLFYDKEGRLWAGTAQGLLQQQLTKPFIQAYKYPPPAGVPNTGGFRCVFRYKDKLYAGRFARSYGLFIIGEGNMLVQKRVSFYGNDTGFNEILSIEMVHPDTLWLGTTGGLLWFDTKSERYGKVLDGRKTPWAADFSPVMAAPRSDGYVWMCGVLEGKVVRYHIPSRTFTLFTSQTVPALPFEKVKSVVYDSFGDVWIGGHSLARFNNKTQCFDTLITVYGGVNKFNDDIVTLQADGEGSLWLHNADNGLLEYRIAEKRFVAYGMKEGLPSTAVHSLAPPVNGLLWLCGNHQLSLFDTHKKTFAVYDGTDGLPEHRPTGRRIYYDRNAGRLYLCSEDYISTFPLVPEQRAGTSSGVLLEELTAANGESFYNPGTALQIPYSENNLTLTYTVIDFEKKAYRFAYRLNGDAAWTPVGTQRSIRFSNLPPGDYALELKASGGPGIEKTTTMRFEIRPPFWRTVPFLTLLSFFVTSCVFLSFRFRVRRIRQRERLDKQLSQTELKALQAQMNPHFIFNSLNSIREMILNNENREASHYLSKFAHLIRLTLDQSSHLLVSLRSTLDYLQRYMEIEAIRNNLFTHSIEVNEEIDLDETSVPPMLIQPFIENAIWHGVSAVRKNIHVCVAFRKEGDYLLCTIDDNGIGILQSQKTTSLNGRRHQSHGITNIKNRIALLNEKYGLHCRVSVSDKQTTTGSGATGTTVRLHLPLQTNER